MGLYGFDNPLPKKRLVGYSVVNVRYLNRNHVHQVLIFELVIKSERDDTLFKSIEGYLAIQILIQRF